MDNSRWIWQAGDNTVENEIKWIPACAGMTRGKKFERNSEWLKE
jgi:hypothetical protein